MLTNQVIPDELLLVESLLLYYNWHRKLENYWESTVQIDKTDSRLFPFPLYIFVSYLQTTLWFSNTWNHSKDPEWSPNPTLRSTDPHYSLVSDDDGQTSVKFGVLFNDEQCANIFEALVGTLKAAKKRKVINFQGELLLQGVHDNTEIVLL